MYFNTNRDKYRNTSFGYLSNIFFFFAIAQIVVVNQ